MKKQSAWSLKNSFNPTIANNLANEVCFVRDTFKENVIWKGKLCKFGD
jgi:hypothetical protein